MDFSRVASVVGLVIALCAVAVAVWVYLRSGVQERTVKILAGENDALSKKVDRLEKDNTELTVRVQALEDENTDLKSQRPSAEAIQALYELLVLHDTTVQPKLDRLLGSRA